MSVSGQRYGSYREHERVLRIINNSIDRSDIAVLLLWSRLFNRPHKITNTMDVIRVFTYSICPSPIYGFSINDKEFRIYSDKDEMLWKIKFSSRTFMVEDLEIRKPGIELEDIVRMIKQISRILYTVVCATANFFSKTRMCRRNRGCEYVLKDIADGMTVLQELNEYPLIDPDVLKTFNSLVEKRVFPFKSSVLIPEEEYRKIRSAFKRYLYINKVNPEIYKSIESWLSNYDRMQNGIGVSIIVRYPSSKEIEMRLGEKHTSLQVSMRIAESLIADLYRMTLMFGRVPLELTRNNLEHVLNLISEWYNVAVSALDLKIERLRNIEGVSRDAIDTAINLLHVWRESLEKNRYEIEKRKLLC
ncbi:MAG: hypothetical protein QXV28_08885 [Ignisphaera sp.]